ncbi:hypothetical protein D3C81_1495300 [compost metagenome]
MLALVSVTSPVPALVKPIPVPLSTIWDPMLKLPVPFCWMPNTPPPEVPVSEPPVIV